MVGLSKKRVFPKTKGDSITGQDRAQKHCDFRFSQIEKKSKVAVLQLEWGERTPGRGLEGYSNLNYPLGIWQLNGEYASLLCSLIIFTSVSTHGFSKSRLLTRDLVLFIPSSHSESLDYGAKHNWCKPTGIE